MDNPALTEILAHAQSCYPQECCGIVILLPDKQLKVLKCINVDPEPTKAFSFDALRLLEAEKEGEIAYIYHSHPDGDAQMSTEDVVQCEELGYPFFVVSWPNRDWGTYRPHGFHTELIGRPFVYGLYDCFTLIRDYYSQKLSIEFPPVVYKGFGWWHEKQNDTFYSDGLKDMGFSVVPTPKLHDVILMQFMADQPNHLAIYLVDGYMLHHLTDRKSELAVYGGTWEKTTRMILRHKSQL